MKWISLFLVILFLGCEVSTEPATDKPYIVITFDDGHKSIYERALPILLNRGYRATNVINTGMIGTGQELSWEQVEELEFVYNWETAGHTLHHITLTNSPPELVEHEIYQDWLVLIEHGLSHNTFALPKGKGNESNFEIILQYYQNVRTSENTTNIYPIDRKNIGYFVYLSEYSAENVLNRILQADERNECMIVIGFHRLMEESGNYPTNCKPDDFQEIIDFIYDHNLEVITLNEACELFSNNQH